MDGLAQDHTFNIKELRFGNSLAVQWLGLSAFIAGAQVQSHKPRGTAKKTNKKITEMRAQGAQPLMWVLSCSGCPSSHIL